MINKYLVILPKKKGSISEEWEQCLEQLKIAESDKNRIVKLNIFADLPDYQACLVFNNDIDSSLSNTFGDKCPAYTVSIHPPEKPWTISVEAAYINPVGSEVQTKRWNSIPYVLRISEDSKELWAGGLGSGYFPVDTKQAASEAFDQIRAILDSEQMSFNHLVRQWNYIGNILEVKDNVQNYQIFNEIRTQNYNRFRNVKGYPAATGIGMKHGGVKIDFYAVKAYKSLKIIPIDNPDQMNPYSYDQQVLVGHPPSGKGKNPSPQFERAVLINGGNNSTLFVSGTASIRGQHTIGLEDVEKQTIVTIENINRLADSGRIKQLAGHIEEDVWRPLLLRVYIRYQKDFSKVKAICEKYFPNVASIYIESDICRDNLLVELETEFNKIG